jgi:predicted dehydrogenase
MLKQDPPDAIINATPDRYHYETCMEIIRKGGIHILCEKPLAENGRDAMEMAEAAEQAGIANMVNFRYRDSSALQKARELIEEGVIGEIRHFEASYLQSWLVSDIWGDWRTSDHWLWRLSKAHGSNGVLGDLGVHILDFLSYPAGDIVSVQCRLKTFEKAEGGRIGEYTLDANDSAVITAELEGGAVGTIHTTRWAPGHHNTLKTRIYGEKGALDVDLDRSWNTLYITREKDINKQRWRKMRCGRTPSVLERFAEAVRTGINGRPDFRRAAEVQKIIDACFKSDSTGTAVTVQASP